MIHILFNNWTLTKGKRALIGICVHYLDAARVLQDYVLGLLILLG